MNFAPTISPDPVLRCARRSLTTAPKRLPCDRLQSGDTRADDETNADGCARAVVSMAETFRAYGRDQHRFVADTDACEDRASIDCAREMRAPAPCKTVTP